MINPDPIHLWWARTDSPEFDLIQTAAILSDDENKRADRFHFPHHRRSFIVSHGMLRSVLGYYLQQPPSSLKFLNDARGKPHLEIPDHGPKMFFSLSHSNEVALCGIALNRQIGVDVEHIRPLSHMASIAKRFFSESELKSILDSPLNARDRIFFLYWTIKEACLKASGIGLPGLGKMHLGHHTRDHASYFCSFEDSEKVWTIQSIHFHDQYCAAVAIEGKNISRQILRKFPDEFYLTELPNKDL